MTYELTDRNGNDAHYSTAVDKRDKLLARAKADGFCGPWSTWTIRHHDFYSDIFANGELVYIATIKLED